MPAGPASPGPSSTAAAALSSIQSVIWGQEESKFKTGGADLRDRPRHVRADHHGARHRRAEEEAGCRRCSTGEEVWCQLFSEPAAGLGPGGPAHHGGEAKATSGSSTARRSGPPAPTSATGASSSCAADPNAAKHAGLSATSWSTCTRRGSKCGPITQINGGQGFNEVFFTDVRIPDSQPPLGGRQRLGGGNHHAHERAQLDRQPAAPAVAWATCCTMAERLEIDGRPAIEDSAVK